MSKFDYENWVAPAEVRGKNQRKKTRGLFRETINARMIKAGPPVYTLREEEKYDTHFEMWIPSAKKIYMNSVDEYSAALKLLGSIEHWNRLLEADWFMYGKNSEKAPRDLHMFGGIVQWREEHESAQKSAALEMLHKQAKKGNVAAIKALMDGQKPKTRGRPTKKEVEGERKSQAKKSSVYSKDAERLAKVINLNNGK